jgi:Acyl-CoA carboxylase epsilon subunit
VAKVPADNDQPPGEASPSEPPPGEPPPGEPPPGEPVLRVVRGDASPEEIAALVAVLASRAAVADVAPEPARSAWSDRSAVLRRPVFPGPGAWRSSALPR